MSQSQLYLGMANGCNWKRFTDANLKIYHSFIPKAIGLYTLNGCVVSCVNYISMRCLKKKSYSLTPLCMPFTNCGTWNNDVMTGALAAILDYKDNSCTLQMAE